VIEEYRYRKSHTTIESGARRDASPPVYGGPKLGNVVATFEFDHRKTRLFATMLIVLILLGLGRIYYDGLAENWLSTFVLVGVPGLALVMIGSDFLMKGPVLIIGEAGLLDRRRGPEPITWDMIEEAELRRRPFINALRIVLHNRDRYDIELALLRADPGEVMILINEQARRAMGTWPPENLG
jgi:hypothetical protein